jgi:hypothetical protein
MAEAGAFLRAAEAENSIIAMPIARMIAAPEPDGAGAYLACALDRDAVVAKAVHPSSGGALVTAGPERALELFAADMAERNRRPKSIVGPLDACEAFTRVWRDRAGCAHALRFHLRHFILTTLPSMPQTRGEMRRPEASEYALIADWQAAFTAQATGVA